jgi:hypothetical protein
MGECLLYSKVSGWKVYYIANIPREGYYIVNLPGSYSTMVDGLLYDTGSKNTAYKEATRNKRGMECG